MSTTTNVEQEIKEIKEKLELLVTLSNNILQLLVKEEEPVADEIAAIKKRKN
ncbi:MAG: hypothetical protein GF308_20055 [Candidatus Heimdallarchaeota archaeon]|nr:hypothetical protein [Candidatus Heimdallarchaeota archaeon]